MGRALKCQWCGNYSPEEEMTKIKKGKANKYYHTKNCYEAFVKEADFKLEEAKKKESLYNTVMEIYGVKALPTSFYAEIECIRHGNKLFKTQSMGRRYRQGYDYSLIEETYKQNVSTIEWSMKNKAFVSLSNALRYGLSIIINHIYEVEQELIRQESIRSMEEVSNTNKIITDDVVDFQTSYKGKKKRKNDISAFVD